MGGGGAAGEPRVDRADRRHHLPQPLLVPHPRRGARGGRAAGSGAVARRPAGGWAGDRGARVGVAVPLPGRRRLRLRRAGQAAAGLARARPAVGAVAAGARGCAGARSRWSASTAVPHAFAIAGAAFDCLIVPLLLWRRTRLAAWVALVAFHVCTWALFPIGVFPWLMIGASTVFFEPDWPRRLLARLGRSVAVPRVAPVRRSPVLPALAVAVGRGAARAPAPPPRLPRRPPLDRRGLPLRLERPARREGRQRHVPRPRTEHRPHLGGRPEPSSTRAPSCGSWPREPDLIHQAAGAIAAEERTRGRHVEVRVDAWVSLNGRPAQRLIDPTVDLAAEPRDPWSDDWILPAPD